MGLKKSILCGMLVVSGALTINTLAATVTGTVKNADTQAAIAGAKITTLLYPGDSTISDANGAFSMTVNVVGINNKFVQAKNNVQNFGSDLKFSLIQKTTVSVDVFNLKGSHLSTLIHREMPAGQFNLNASVAGLSSGNYLFVVNMGGQVKGFNFSTLGNQFFANNLQELNSKPNILAKKSIVDSTVTVDYLVVIKDGYLLKNANIFDYAEPVQVMLKPSGMATANLNIYSEGPGPMIDFANGNGTIYVWESTCTLLSDSTNNIGHEGTRGMLVTKAGLTWSGWAFHVTNRFPGMGQSSVDMSGYTGGSVHFWVKSADSSLALGVSSTDQGQSPSVILKDSVSFGYQPDNAWHEVNVPFTAFPTIDLKHIFVYAAFITTTGDTSSYIVDDIYYKKP